VGAFNESEVKRIIKASQAYRPVALLSVGYAAEKPRIRSRRNLSDLVHKV
jgi:nitroreductase